MNKKDKSFEIGIIICLVVFSILLFGVYLLIDIYNSKRSYVLFLKPYTILSCEKWDCTNVSDKLDDYNNKPHYIFLNGSYNGSYDLYYNSTSEKYYIFDALDNNIYKNERMLAYSGKAKIVQKYFVESELKGNELYELEEATKMNLNSENVVKITLDFDSDGELESIFSINSSEEDLNVYSILVYQNDGKYYVIDKNTNSDLGYSYISNIMDIFENGSLEFIYTSVFNDNIGACNIIYRLKGNKFVSVNECEIVK